MKRIIYLLLVTLTISSCTDLTEVEDRLDFLEQEVTDIQN